MAQNQEIKCRCPDFRPVRRTLREIGAERLGVHRQVDTYLKLPPGAGAKRLKLRREGNTVRLIAYSDTYADGLRHVEYYIGEASSGLGYLLERALGVSAVVSKKREQWRKDSTLFNLDIVEGVGGVFEVEVIQGSGEGNGVVGLYQLFAAHLGEPILGSNEDLVRDRQ